MISFRDKILSQVLLQHNLVAPDSLQSCWASRQMDSVSGETSDLPQILISQGYLNDAQVDKLLRQIDSAIFFCMSCQENYFLPNVSPDSVVRCQKCQRSLDCLADAPITIGGMFAHYRIQKELGRGGMGAVYEVYDTKLDRTLALKVILAGDQVNEKQLKRFLREAKSTAKLRHPNIVEVYEVGYTPQNYFTMEHVIGQSFSERIKQGHMSMKLIATIMKKSSEALHLAHKNNLIHRDIKPSNIMLTQDNEPKIMDFGLVKIIEADEKLSQSGQMMGTPAYMPPEQADGKNVSAKSDVYSLGATLYQALTGRPPFQGESYLNILRQVYSEEPLSPRTLNPDVPIELEAICLKCLEKKAFHRYRSAKELAQDLNNFLCDKPIQAKPMTSLVKIRKLISRNKAITLVTVFAVLTLSIALSLSFSKVTKERNIALGALKQSEENAAKFEKEKIRAQTAEKERKEERDNAIFNQRAAEKSRQEALQAVYYSSILLAQKYILDYQLPQAQGMLNSHGAKNLRDWEWNWLKRRGNYERMSWPIGRGLNRCVYSPDGKKIAITQGNIIHILDAVNGEEIFLLEGHEEGITCCAFHPSKEVLISGGNDSLLIFWNLESGKPLQRIETSADFNDLAFSPKGEKFVSVHDIPDEKTKKEYYQAVFLWETKTGTILNKWSPYENRSWENNVECCAFHPNGKVIAIGGEDNNIRLWSLISGKEIAVLEGDKNSVIDCSFSPDGRYLVSAGHNLLVVIWDLRTKKKLHVLQGHTQSIRTCSFTPDGQKVVSAGDDDLLIIWSTKDGERLGTLTGHLENIRDCSISPDGKKIVTTSKDRTVKIWETEAYRNKNPNLLADLGNIVYHMSISPNGQNLFVGVKGVLGVKCLDATTGKVKKFSDNSYPFQGIFASASQTIFTKNGQTLIMAGYDRSITTWDVISGKKIDQEFASGKKMATFISHGGGVRSCSLNPDESLLASCDQQGWVVIWDFHSGQELNKYRHRKGEVNFVKFSPDGKTLASCSEDDTVILWDVEKERVRHIFREHPEEVFMLDFDEKGERIISSSEGEERNLLLWDSRTGELLARYENHVRDVTSCQFSPNGKRILSAGEDKTICIWDAHPKTKEENLRQSPLLILKGQGAIESCFFSADGSKIYSAYGNGEIRLWDASPSK